MLRKDIRKGWIWAVSTLWAGTVLAQPVAAPHVPSRPDSHMVAQLWESAWQRQPEAAGEGAWQQAAQARQETAGSWVAGPMALEASTKTDRFNNRNGQREYEVGVAIPLWMPGERASSARWADAESLALSSRMLAAKLRTAGQVRQAWWAWQRAQAELVAAQDRTRSADAGFARATWRKPTETRPMAPWRRLVVPWPLLRPKKSRSARRCWH